MSEYHVTREAPDAAAVEYEWMVIWLWRNWLNHRYFTEAQEGEVWSYFCKVRKFSGVVGLYRRRKRSSVKGEIWEFWEGAQGLKEVLIVNPVQGHSPY